MEVRHVLYSTTSKPIEVKGIPLLWWAVVIVGSGTSSIIFSAFLGGGGYLLGLTVFFFLWGFGFLMSRKDPEFAAVWFKKRVVLSDTKSLTTTNTRRYEP
jgi:hypothetical protein